MKKIFVLWFVTLLAVWALPFAKVEKMQGTAKAQQEGSIKKKAIGVGFEFERGDTVLTYGDTKVVLQLEDKTKIVLDAYAKLTFVSQDEFIQSGGKVYFKVTKRKGASGLKVKTPFAIIGVKGTEFVVTDNENEKALALNEGLVGVDSPDGKPFAKVDKDKLDKMIEGSPSQVQAEFEAYKKELMKEFTEYVKSFDLTPGKKLSFDGKTVYESSQNENDTQMFKGYMSDAEFKAVSDELDADFSEEKRHKSDGLSDGFFDK